MMETISKRLDTARHYTVCNRTKRRFLPALSFCRPYSAQALYTQPQGQVRIVASRRVGAICRFHIKNQLGADRSLTGPAYD